MKQINESMQKEPRQESAFPWFVWTAVGLLVLGGLFVLSHYNFLLFHGIAELFSIAVAWAVFMLVWNARSFIKNDALLHLGAAYLFIGFVDILHTLAYKGMGVFATHGGANLPTQLWISARYMEGLALLSFAYLLGRSFRITLSAGFWLIITVLFLVSIFVWPVFPDCFLEETGLTLFKKGSEYLICLIVFGALVLLRQKRDMLDPVVYRLVAASMLLTIGAELAFTFYVDVYDLSNVAGHFFKIISFVLIYMALIQSGLKKPYALLFRDLVKEKDALRKSQSLFKKVFEVLPIGLWIADRQGKLLQGNPAAKKIWGAKPLVEQSDYGVFKARRLPSGEEIAPDDWALVHTVNKGMTVVDEMLEIDTFDGEKRIILNNTAPILDQYGQVEAAVVLNQDITQRKQAEDKLRQVNEKLEKANAEKDKLFTFVAHDLKSPIAGFLNLTRMLEEDFEDFSREDIRQVAVEMHKSSENLYALLTDLLQWAQVNQKRMDFFPQVSSLDDLIRISLSIVKTAADQKKITLKNTVPPGVAIFADQKMISTVIRNLVFNAVKYTNRGGNISISAYRQDSMVKVEVQDDGTGMDQDTAEKIFAIDQKVSLTGTEGEKGTGLGLIICREFVERNHGRIWIESEPGRGTTVCFTVPAAEGDAAVSGWDHKS